jgi:hypothetical protein
MLSKVAASLESSNPDSLNGDGFTFGTECNHSVPVFDLIRFALEQRSKAIIKRYWVKDNGAFDSPAATSETCAASAR